MKTFYVPYYKTKEDEDKMKGVKDSYTQELLPSILERIERANYEIDINTKSKGAGFFM